MAEPAHTEASFRHRLGPLALDVTLALTAPWTVLFGASGSGKSTIVRAVAGLVRPHAGTIRLRGQPVCDTASSVWIPPHRRPVRWAGQRAALFPHLTVRANIGRGVAAEGGRGADARRDRVLEHFELGPLADRLPGQLSGGQQQRVAVARAAAGAVGKLLLLDEPFSGLDAAVRDALIAQLRSWLGATPILSVTHDVGEAFLLGAEVLRIAEGKVVAKGPVGTVLASERNHLLTML